MQLRPTEITSILKDQIANYESTGDIAEVPVPDRSEPDDPREQLAVLSVEHMDGLRVDRVALRLLGPVPQGGGRA